LCVFVGGGGGGGGVWGPPGGFGIGVGKKYSGHPLCAWLKVGLGISRTNADS